MCVAPSIVNLSDRGLLATMVIPFCIGSFVLVNEFTKSKLSMALNVVALGCGLLYHRLLRKSPTYVYSSGAATVHLDQTPMILAGDGDAKGPDVEMPKTV